MDSLKDIIEKLGTAIYENNNWKEAEFFFEKLYGVIEDQRGLSISEGKDYQENAEEKIESMK